MLSVFASSLLLLSNELIKSLIPIIRKVNDANDLRTTSGTKVDIDPPVRAPIKEDPRNTAKGLFEVPLIVRVANCVLSPNSAINTVKKVDNNKLKIIYK